MMGRTIQPEAAQTTDHLPAHAEPTDSLSKFTAEAHESYNNTRFEPASANPNPGNNTEVAAMLQDFALVGELVHPYQTEGAPPLNPPGEFNQIPNQGEYAPNRQSELPNSAPQTQELPYQLPGQEAFLQNPALQYPEFSSQLPGQEAYIQNPTVQAPELPGQIPGHPQLSYQLPRQNP